MQEIIEAVKVLGHLNQTKKLCGFLQKVVNLITLVTQKEDLILILLMEKIEFIFLVTLRVWFQLNGMVLMKKISLRSLGQLLMDLEIQKDHQMRV